MNEDPIEIQVNWNVSPAFKEWEKKERRRKGVRTRALLDMLAQLYIVEEQKAGRTATDWPVEP